ncbi:MAG: hypothetical protein RMI30_00285 [Thermodesulfovibrio sp.]|nr:hypothetical protein [Thermodesulfovibrio sp.]
MLTELSLILNRNRQYLCYLLRKSAQLSLRNGNVLIITDATASRGKVIKQYEMEIPVNRILRIKEIKDNNKKWLIKLRNSIDIVWLSE